MQAECSSRWMGVVVIVVVWSSMGVAVGSDRRKQSSVAMGVQSESV